ncbi:MAG: hypothetical protein Q9168_007725 [Polycauliona sp. 1 TL-2023]
MPLNIDAVPPREIPDDRIFPILELPLELRRQIYTYLLVPSTSLSVPLNDTQITWHDRDDRHRPQTHLFISPQILRVNRQINVEATPILYAQNTIKIVICSTVIAQCSGGMYADRRRGRSAAQYLLRSYALEQPVPRYFDPGKPGFIYPHCLQRIANIELALKASAIWGHSHQGYPGGFFSHAGELVVEILRLLAAEKEWDDAGGERWDLQGKQNRLMLIVYHDEEALFPWKRKEQRLLKKQEQEDEQEEEQEEEQDGQRQKEERYYRDQDALAARIPLLTEAVALRRDVQIVEVEPFSDFDIDRLKTREVELKDFMNL